MHTTLLMNVSGCAAMRIKSFKVPVVVGYIVVIEYERRGEIVSRYTAINPTTRRAEYSKDIDDAFIYRDYQSASLAASQSLKTKFLYDEFYRIIKVERDNGVTRILGDFDPANLKTDRFGEENGFCCAAK